MILSLLIALLACAWLAGRLGWRRLRLAGVALAVAAVFAIGCGPVPHLLLRGWQAPYAHRPALDWATSNTIVLLTANANNPPGDVPEPGPVGYARVAETMSLYNACRAAGMHCTVLVSGGDAYATGEPLAQVYGKALAGLGLPAADMVLEPRSRTTWQNAEFALCAARAHRRTAGLAGQLGIAPAARRVRVPPLRHRGHAGAGGLRARRMVVATAGRQPEPRRPRAA
jgi:uncharacterized SAM-binding protein YcdF (DUF218 family)